MHAVQAVHVLQAVQVVQNMQNMVNVQNISISIFLLHHKMFSLRNCLAQEFCFGLLQVFAYIVLDLPYFSAISFRFMGILLTLKHCQRHN